jgi:hypothetical protein
VHPDPPCAAVVSSIDVLHETLQCAIGVSLFSPVTANTQRRRLVSCCTNRVSPRALNLDRSAPTCPLPVTDFSSLAHILGYRRVGCSFDHGRRPSSSPKRPQGHTSIAILATGGRERADAEGTGILQQRPRQKQACLARPSTG